MALRVRRGYWPHFTGADAVAAPMVLTACSAQLLTGVPFCGAPGLSAALHRYVHLRLGGCRRRPRLSAPHSMVASARRRQRTLEAGRVSVEVPLVPLVLPYISCMPRWHSWSRPIASLHRRQPPPRLHAEMPSALRAAMHSIYQLLPIYTCRWANLVTCALAP